MTVSSFSLYACLRPPLRKMDLWDSNFLCLYNLLKERYGILNFVRPRLLLLGTKSQLKLQRCHVMPSLFSELMKKLQRFETHFLEMTFQPNLNVYVARVPLWCYERHHHHLSASKIANLLKRRPKSQATNIKDD